MDLTRGFGEKCAQRATDRRVRARLEAMRGRQAETLIAGFRIVTPAVIGGVDNRNGAAELRLSSILGPLRFWWRALAWGRACAEIPANGRAGDDPALVKERLGQVANWQMALFGGPADDKAKDRGQGAFVVELRNAKGIRSLRCKPPNCGYPQAPFLGNQQKARSENRFIPWDRSGFALGYLAGQGFSARIKGQRFIRQALVPGATFELHFRTRPGALADMFTPSGSGAPSLLDALWAFSLFGGVGSRTRRGFGSLQLTGLTGAEGVTLPRNYEEFRERVREFHRKWCTAPTVAPHDDIPFTAFSCATRFVLRRGEAREAMHNFHNRIGFDFVKFRSNGNKGLPDERTVAGNSLPIENGEPRFWADHEWFKGHVTPRGAQNVLPKRAVFGMPHNYFSRCDGPLSLPKWSDNEKNGFDRRASPVMLTIREFSGMPVAVWAAMPARMFPYCLPKESGTAYVGAKAGKAPLHLTPTVDWGVVDDYFDQLADWHGDAVAVG